MPETQGFGLSLTDWACRDPVFALDESAALEYSITYPSPPDCRIADLDSVRSSACQGFVSLYRSPIIVASRLCRRPRI
jgi:hypothetical protein